MPDPVNNPDNSFATGIEANHIGPETGSTGSASVGGASSAGVSGNTSPAPASGMGRTLETDDLEAGEPRSFDPPRKSAAAADDGDMGDSPDALKRATDGEEQKSRPLE
jgi:hypothetical protein